MVSKHERIGDMIANGRAEEAAKHVREALESVGGNQTKAAEKMGVSGRGMRRWIARLASLGHDVRVGGKDAPKEPSEKKPARKKRAA